jgi:hypothetical protein
MGSKFYSNGHASIDYSVTAGAPCAAFDPSPVRTSDAIPNRFGVKFGR